jgi:adenine-specific DNA-methyltransferase
MPTPRQLQLVAEPMDHADLIVDPGATYGEVFTRRWVVDLILDLVGYTPDRDLAAMVLVEPSCGSGAFLGPIVERLIESARAHRRDLGSMEPPVRAFDLLEANAELARKVVSQQLREGDLLGDDPDAVARRWVTTADFLLQDHPPESADFVVGNPPYIRLENVAPDVMAAYRRACSTMRGRSDIYVGFIERGLELLRPSGVLGYICADRWMRNQYGGELRRLITDSYAVDTVVTMHDADAFENDVSAYPAIVVLRNEAQGRANVVEAGARFGVADADKVTKWARGGRRRTVTTPNLQGARTDGWLTGSGLWPTGSPAQLAVVAELEARYPPLQDAATRTRVGIGVATGRDNVYITGDAGLVEPERLLPLLQSSDTSSGLVQWRGNYLVNPWNEGDLVDLDEYPRLKSYYLAHAASLKERHVARKSPAHWYRTIDRVDPSLAGRQKLVLPDLKASSHPVLADGTLYPHHNLYFVLSDVWDLEVLGGLLLSNVANLFVGTYCVRMRGGCYRFQAQYLRRIRVPRPESLTKQDRRALASAFADRDVERATGLALKVYGIRARS